MTACVDPGTTRPGAHEDGSPDRRPPRDGRDAATGLARGAFGGVSEGTRTPDRLDHNQELYQLSYAHHGSPSRLARSRGLAGPDGGRSGGASGSVPPMQQIAPGVRRLGSDMVNFYAVEEGGRTTLVDAGLPGFRGQVAEAVGDLANLAGIVLTHAHGDHVGVAERLRSEANVPVYVHVADEDMAHTAKPGKREGSLLPYLRRGATWRLLAHMVANGGARPQKIQEVTTFTDGEVLELPGRPRVIATPGHTLGHCALHFASHGVLFTGDEIVTWNPLTGRRGPQIMPAAFNVSSEQCLASLERLEALEAAVLAPGHGEPWTEGPRAAVEQARANGTS